MSNFDKENRKENTNEIQNRFLKFLLINQKLSCLIQFQIFYITYIIY